MSLEDYAVEKAIGRGHFSVVHRAVRKQDGRRVALKKVQIFDMMDAKARERCLKEVNLLQTLPVHPCIIQYIDSFIDNNELYIVFEWAEHGDLRRLLRRAQESNASLQEPQIWRYFTQVCQGVCHMHEARVMHRDIKPANIFLAANGCVKLGDLGLGRAFSSNTYEALSKVGTPLYMSPEVLDGRGYEWKSDVWSLGCLLYELATLRSPFKNAGDKDNLYTLFKKISIGKFSELPGHYSAELAQLVNAMIQTDPTQRPDIHETLQAASSALASFEAAAKASAAEAGGGNGNGTRTGADCFIVMEAVLDKLKLLQYERGLLHPRDMQPLPRGYFTSATLWPPAAQFRYLFQLLCWLLELSALPGHELWGLLPAQCSDADTLAAAAGMLEQMAKVGGGLSEQARMAPQRLRSACGIEVCALLNTLTDMALAAANFVWEQPRHLSDPEIDPEIQDEDEDGPSAAATAVVTSTQQLGGDLDEETPSEGGGSQTGLLLPLLQSTIEPGLWVEECARCAPQLSVRVPWSQLHWRHRLAQLRQHGGALSPQLEEIEPRLRHAAKHAAELAASLAPVQAAWQQAEGELGAANERLSQRQKHVDELASQLRSLEEALEQTQEAVRKKGTALSDGSPVANIRGAMRTLQKETRELTLRLAHARVEYERRLRGHVR